VYPLAGLTNNDELRSVPMESWLCTICQYVYDPAQGDPENGIAAGTPFGQLPAEWVCPVCGAGKEAFTEIEA
jgi:rubredoxin